MRDPATNVRLNMSTIFVCICHLCSKPDFFFLKIFQKITQYTSAAIRIFRRVTETLNSISYIGYSYTVYIRVYSC